MSIFPQELYTILIYDYAGTLQLILERWLRLEYHQRVNGAWNHQITLEFGSDDPYLDVVRGIKDDWIINVHRIDPVLGTTSKVYEGFHTTRVDQTKINGGILINLYGSGYTRLLKRRIVTPPSGSEYSTKSGKAETVIKGYINDSMIAPTDTTRVLEGMAAAADLSRGNDVIYSARYTNLLSVCDTLSEQGPLDYGVYGGASIGEFIFDARNLWGSDKTVENPTGNPEIIFSIERDNMTIPILSENTSSEQNFAYVGGEGQGAARNIVEVFDYGAVNRTPWSRKEFFVEGRQQGSDTALIALGNEELFNRRITDKLSFNVNQTDSSRWIRDWALGDLITAAYYLKSFPKQIVEIGVVVASTGSTQQIESINVEFEDARI